MVVSLGLCDVVPVILLSAMWNHGTTGVQDDGEKAGELIRVKRTKTVSRGRVRDLGHILVS